MKATVIFSTGTPYTEYTIYEILRLVVLWKIILADFDRQSNAHRARKYLTIPKEHKFATVCPPLGRDIDMRLNALAPRNLPTRLLPCALQTLGELTKFGPAAEVPHAKEFLPLLSKNFSRP